MTREPTSSGPMICCLASSPAKSGKPSRGLTRRITALNLFLKDIYHDGRILSDGVAPRWLVYSCKHFRREMRGPHFPHNIYVAVDGTDLVRLPGGRFAVLEDNLRVPAAYLTCSNRQVMNVPSPHCLAATVSVPSTTMDRRCSARCCRWPRLGDQNQ